MRQELQGLWGLPCELQGRWGLVCELQGLWGLAYLACNLPPRNRLVFAHLC